MRAGTRHEVEARTKGIPVLGSGRIFPVPEETIACEHRDFPSHWPRLGAMDFGWDHPFAAFENHLPWDRRGKKEQRHPFRNWIKMRWPGGQIDLVRGLSGV